jgi:hypothetical protein
MRYEIDLKLPGRHAAILPALAWTPRAVGFFNEPRRTFECAGL